MIVTYALYPLEFSSLGLIFLKLKYIAMSYSIFRTPPRTNGADNSGNNCGTEPINEGDTACEMFLEMLVIAAAAALSPLHSQLPQYMPV